MSIFKSDLVRNGYKFFISNNRFILSSTFTFLNIFWHKITHSRRKSKYKQKLRVERFTTK